MKIGLIAVIAAITGTLALATYSTPEAQAEDACQHKELKTVMVRDACKSGGQKAAKDVMKKWNKEKGIKSCNQCHTKLAPSYELKADAFDQFVKLGGKLIDTKGAKAPLTPAKPK